MKRRSFLAGLALAPAASIVARAGVPAETVSPSPVVPAADFLDVYPFRVFKSVAEMNSNQGGLAAVISDHADGGIYCYTDIGWEKME